MLVVNLTLGWCPCVLEALTGFHDHRYGIWLLSMVMRGELNRVADVRKKEGAIMHTLFHRAVLWDWNKRQAGPAPDERNEHRPRMISQGASASASSYHRAEDAIISKLFYTVPTVLPSIELLVASKGCISYGREGHGRLYEDAEDYARPISPIPGLYQLTDSAFKARPQSYSITYAVRAYTHFHVCIIISLDTTKRDPVEAFPPC